MICWQNSTKHDLCPADILQNKKIVEFSIMIYIIIHFLPMPDFNLILRAMILNDDFPRQRDPPTYKTSLTELSYPLTLLAEHKILWLYHLQRVWLSFFV